MLDGSELIALAEVAIDVVAGADGSVELDPDQLWESVLAAAGAALTEAGNVVASAWGLDCSHGVHISTTAE